MTEVVNKLEFLPYKINNLEQLRIPVDIYRTQIASLVTEHLHRGFYKRDHNARVENDEKKAYS